MTEPSDHAKGCKCRPGQTCWQNAAFGKAEPAHRRKPPIFSWYFEDLAVAVLNVLYWDAEGNWGVADEVLS